MTKRIEGYVDQFVYPEGYDHGDGEYIYISKGKTLSRDLPAVLFIGEGSDPPKVLTEEEVKAMLREVGLVASGSDYPKWLIAVAAKHGITL